jgi:hypothetical protein
MGTNTAGFYGKVVAADCDCHKGLYFVEAYAMDPQKQAAILIGRCPFDTKKQAEDSMVKYVKDCALYFMEQNGVGRNQVLRAEQYEGEIADKMVETFMKENNPGLH